MPDRSTILARMGSAQPEFPFQNYLSGLEFSTAGSSVAFATSAGCAMDSTNTVLMTLASAMTKTTNPWTAGNNNGGLDTGSMSGAAWYTRYLIGGANVTPDIIYSSNSSSPSLPTGYTYYRRLGGQRYGGTYWDRHIQKGDYNYWLTPFADYNSTPGAGHVTTTISVPPGVVVSARLIGFNINTSVGACMLITSPDMTAPTINSPRGLMTVRTQVTNVPAPFDAWFNTDASRQIRQTYDTASNDTAFSTAAWYDWRGK